MSFHYFSPSHRLDSPSSSPPPPSPVSTPPKTSNSTAQSQALLPSPPHSVKSGSSVPSYRALVRRALEYINHRDTESPSLRITGFSWDDFEEFEDELSAPCYISAKAAESLRYDYDPKSLLLRICPMPKAAHNALEGFLTKTLIRLRCQNALTEAEEDELELNFGTAINLPYRDTTARVGRKPPATAKQPDAAITLMTGIDSLFPRVVFEVGFSQTYDELFDDVRQWLERSEGAIPVAILIYIEEHPIESAPDGNTTDDESTLHSDDSEASDVALYRRLRASCDVDRYVGLISAFAEVFRFGPTGVYRDGTRVNIISHPSIAPAVPAGCISLSITDLLPHVADGRAITLDMAVYARGLQNSRGKMALGRVLEERKRRSQAAGREKGGDADYRLGGDVVLCSVSWLVV